MPQTEAWITMGFVGNEVGGPLVGTALWQGVLLADVLRAARPRPGATQVVGRSVDGYTGAFGLPLALDGRTARIALGMNGEPLPVAHGFPARLVVPGHHGSRPCSPPPRSATTPGARGPGPGRRLRVATS